MPDTPIIPPKPILDPGDFNPELYVKGGYIPPAQKTIDKSPTAVLQRAFEPILTENNYNLAELQLPVITPWEQAKRYDNAALGYNPEDPNNEDLYGRHQAWYKQLTNGILKGVTVAGTSFIDGTVGFVSGAMEASLSGDFSKLWNNDISNAMQDVREWSEEVLPNFYTNEELNAPLLSPDYWANMNFLGDKLIKNLGWAAAAIGEGVLVAKALKHLSKLTALGKSEAIVGDLERAVSAVKSGQVPASQAKGFLESKLTSYLAKPNEGLGELGSIQYRYGKLSSSVNRVIERTAGAVASTSEANMEALNGYRNLKSDLIEQYKESHGGAMPDDEALKEIEERATHGGNMQFLWNVGLLSVTNNIQLPLLMNGALKFEKKNLNRQLNSLTVKGSDNAIAKLGEEYAVKQRGWLSTTSSWAARNLGIVAPVEGLEEGLQYAGETGIHDYELRTKDPRAIEALGNIVTEGFGNMIGTREGLENILLGTLSGGVMQKAMGGFGQGAQRAADTNDFLSQTNRRDVVNQAGQFVQGTTKKEGFTDELAKSVVRGISIAMDKNQATQAEDHYTAKNLEDDFVANYVMPRLKYNRYDQLVDELSQYKKIDAEDAIKELGLPEDTTKEEIDGRVDSLLNKARVLKELWEKMTLAYGQKFNEVDGQKVAKYRIPEMVYAAYKMQQAEQRMDGLKNDIDGALSTVFADKVITTEALTNKNARKYVDQEGNQKEYDLEEVRNELQKRVNLLNPVLQTDANGIPITEKIRDIERLQNQREQILMEYEDLKNNVSVNDAIDISTVSPEDYIKFESRRARNEQINELRLNTEIRPFSNEIESIVEKEQPKGTELSEILQTVKDTNTFLWDRNRESVIDLINKALESYNTTTSELEALNAQEARMDELFDLQTNFGIGMPDMFSEEDEQELTELENSYKERQQQIQTLEQKLEAEKLDVSKLLQLREQLGAQLENVKKEPLLLSPDQLRYRLAEKIVEGYQEIKDNVDLVATTNDEGKIIDLGDYGDERTLEIIGDLIDKLDSLKRIFSGRTDISFTSGPFKNYLKILDTRKEFLQNVQEVLEKRLADRDAIQKRSEQVQVEGMVNAFGFDIKSGEIIHQELYDITAASVGDQFETLLNTIKTEKRLELVHQLMDLFKNGVSADNISRLRSIQEKILKDQNDIILSITTTPGLETTLDNAVKNYTNNPHQAFQDVLRIAVIPEELTAPGPYKSFLWHKNLYQLNIDTQNTEAVEGSDKFISLANRKQLISNQALFMALDELIQATESSVSYADIYSALRLTVTDANRKGENTPTTQQLISIIQSVKFFFRTASQGYDNWAYVEGVIGAGKTSIYTKYLLNTLNELKERVGVKELVYATANTETASKTLNESLGLEGAPDTSDLINALNDDSFDNELIVLDEAARLRTKDIESIEKALTSFNKRNKKEVKLIAIGDTDQISDAVFIGIQRAPDLRALNPLSISYRSGVAAIADIQAVYKAAGSKDITELVSSGSVTTIPEGAGKIVYGVYGSKDQDDIVSILNTRPAGTTKAVIVNKGKEAFWRNKINDPAITVVNYYDAQGKTFDEVYLWIEKDANDPLVEDTVGLNTAIYTDIRGRNLVFLGGVNVTTQVKPSVLATVQQNDEQNKNRGQELVKKLNKAVTEFEKLTPGESRFSVDPVYSNPIDQMAAEQIREDMDAELLTGITGEEQMTDEDEIDEIPAFEDLGRSEEIYTELEDEIISEPANKTTETGEPVIPIQQTTLPQGKEHKLNYVTSQNLQNLRSDQVLFMAVPNNKGGFKVSVVQPTGVEGEFKELAVLSEGVNAVNEVEMLGLQSSLNTLNDSVSDREFKSQIKAVFNVDLNSSTLPEIADKIKVVGDSSNFILGSATLKMSDTNPLQYSYNNDKGIKDTIFNKATSIFKYTEDLIRKVFPEMKLAEPKMDNAKAYENPNAVDYILRGTEKNRKKYRSPSGKEIIKKSRMYLLFQGKNGYQAVELKGRVLDYSEPLHYKIYGDPVEKFFTHAEDFEQEAQLGVFFANNKDLLKNASLTENDFKSGSRFWNKLIIMLSDGNIEHQLSDKFVFNENDPKIALYRGIIEYLKTKNIARIRKSAQMMDDLAYNKQLIKKYQIVDSNNNPVSDQELFDTEDAAYKVINNNVGSGWEVKPINDTFKDDFGEIQVRHRGRNNARSGRTQLAVEHLMKANPVVEVNGRKLFPVYTKTYKDKKNYEVRRFIIRNVLHHNLKGGISKQHPFLLEQYLIRKLGIDKELGLKYNPDNSAEKYKALASLRKYLSETYNRMKDMPENIGFEAIVDDLSGKFISTGENELVRLVTVFGGDVKIAEEYADLMSFSSPTPKQSNRINELRPVIVNMVAGFYGGDPAIVQLYRDQYAKVEAVKTDYDLQLEHRDIRALLHPKEAISKTGEHKLGLRLNPPLMMRYITKDREHIQFDPVTGKASEPELKRYTSEEIIHTMFTTRFTGVTGAGATIIQNNRSQTEEQEVFGEFVSRIMAGERISSNRELQYYENNKELIEQELLKRREIVTGLQEKGVLKVDCD